ncbi:class II fumarate hydratase [Fictibacillus barbaricus]|uniref:Fumarate hydratase class II n=2 Tax=Fictibacillus barbaricus TaxID=182136 RepID=A0ABS2Z7X8_9BACL|nr:class II fumarate hydratase [Fictibacillus barbaricus]
MGEVHIPSDKMWGPQTQRSLINFKIGTEMMPIGLIRALAYVKRAAAKANLSLGVISEERASVIIEVTEEILEGKWDDQFPLVVWQTGSGTQTNMNMNEVIANRGNMLLKKKGSHEKLHPNDDVNRSQSSNDTFPTAMHIAAVLAVEEALLPVINELKETLQMKTNEFKDLIKIGRTHLQDATPLTLGQEISGWSSMLEKTYSMIQASTNTMKELAIGGTAVGTGLNAHPLFGEIVAEEISRSTGIRFLSANNKFHALSSHDQIVYTHGAIKALAGDLMKIANDVRWLASGPRCGIGEIMIPSNEPGSSIMPGKVNPTQSEALTMVVCQVMGNDATVGFAASQGNFQLNVFKPVIIHSFLQSVGLLTDAILSFNKHCATGITANEEVIKKYLNESLMLVTALNPHIGYEKAAEIAKKAFDENITLKEAAVKSKLLTEEQFEMYVRPEKMVE